MIQGGPFWLRDRQEEVLHGIWEVFQTSHELTMGGLEASNGVVEIVEGFRAEPVLTLPLLERLLATANLRNERLEGLDSLVTLEKGIVRIGDPCLILIVSPRLLCAIPKVKSCALGPCNQERDRVTVEEGVPAPRREQLAAP